MTFSIKASITLNLHLPSRSIKPRKPGGICDSYGTPYPGVSLAFMSIRPKGMDKNRHVRVGPYAE